MNSGRWAVFVSGRGSNLEAFFELMPQLDIRLVVSSRRKALAVQRARRWGVETFIQDSRMPWSELTAFLRQRGINRLFLLGYMKILPREFVEDWAGKMWNLHPSLLPDFPGLESIEKSYEGNGRMGVSIHQVTEDMDAGPICLQFKICEKAKDEMSWNEAQLKISQTEQRLVREWATRQNGP